MFFQVKGFSGKCLTPTQLLICRKNEHRLLICSSLSTRQFQKFIGLQMVCKNTIPETNSLHLKMDGWNTTFLLGRPIFRGENVSFREGMPSSSSSYIFIFGFFGSQLPIYQVTRLDPWFQIYRELEDEGISKYIADTNSAISDYVIKTLKLHHFPIKFIYVIFQNVK